MFSPARLHSQKKHLTRTSGPRSCPASTPYSDSCSPLIYHGVSDREPPAPVGACWSFRWSPALMNHV
ncbi:Hypp1258 [Branchiostoma lanceolatum]|uniref:Hypp1258 protein n=1 Tax=Branchiostoma lanceolatum TaxID=7740 RepID=A0A8K0EJW5_BRALA|nr:Hypp1258 [Branchiostoma lanceolatum]